MKESSFCKENLVKVFDIDVELIFDTIKNDLLPLRTAIVALFSAIDLIEVIEPESVRKEMRKFAQSFMSYYNTL